MSTDSSEERKCELADIINQHNSLSPEISIDFTSEPLFGTLTWIQ
jgi:hypothetical protein